MEDWRLPEDPELRLAAEALEEEGDVAELYDRKWRVVFISTALEEMLELPPEVLRDAYGMSPLLRNVRHGEYWQPDRESQRRWWAALGAGVVHDVPPDDPDFESVFGPVAELAREQTPRELPPLLTLRQSFAASLRFRSNWSGDVKFMYVRLRRADGALIGIAAITRADIPATLGARLARGSAELYAAMDRMREPRKRAAAIMFADLEGSGELSRRLSSRAYFGLIRSLTDLIDSEVVRRGGITGKHAGDGASALFVAEAGAEQSTRARGSVEAARAIASGAEGLLAADGPEVRVNVGLHWGGTLTIGQVSSSGRLEVTALGDEMNEAARIEAVARGGGVLASKPLVERLEPEDAAAVGLEPEGLAYTPLTELGAEGKAARDAGAIAVARI